MSANPHIGRAAAVALAFAGAGALFWSDRAGLAVLATFASWEKAQATAVLWRLSGATLLGAAAALLAPAPRSRPWLPELLCAACILLLCPVLREASLVVRQLCLGTIYRGGSAAIDGAFAPIATCVLSGGGLWCARALKRFRPPLVAVAALAFGAWALWCAHENVFLPYRGIFYSIPAVAGAALSVAAAGLIVAATIVAARSVVCP